MKQNNNNILEIKVNNYTKCEWCDNQKELGLRIPWKLWMEWNYISSKMGSKEWGAVFTVENGVVTKYEIPQQEVSSSSCDFKEDLSGNGIVHSHHTMGSFHSAQDDKQARNLFEYSIVLSSTGYEACKRIKIPCGGWSYIETKVVLIGVPVLNLNKITEEAVVQYSPIYAGWLNKNKEEKEKKEVGTGVAVLDEDDYQTKLLAHCNNCIDFNCNECEHYEDMLNEELGCGV